MVLVLVILVRLQQHYSWEDIRNDPTILLPCHNDPCRIISR